MSAKRIPGSWRVHENLVEACLQVCDLMKIPAWTIATTGKPQRATMASGEPLWRLRGNPRQRGMTDIVLCLHGAFVGVECKSGDAVPSKVQREQHEKIEQAGGYVFIARSAIELRDWLLTMEKQYDDWTRKIN